MEARRRGEQKEFFYWVSGANVVVPNPKKLSL
jgi:hypothetical protein